MVSLAGVVVLATGVAVGALLVPSRVPEGIAKTAPPASAPATRMNSIDAQAATLVITLSDAQKIVSPVAGTVTSTNCSADGVIVSGTSAVSVDDAPLVFLATPRPLWRDLEVGESGADVSALQQELARLGRDVGIDGRFGRRTLAAVIDVAKDAGVTGATAWTSLPASSFLWLPAPTVRIASCDALLGSRIDPGSPLMSLPQGLSAARVSPVPANLFPGDRVINVGDRTVPVDGDGVVASAEGLESLAQSDAFAAFQANGTGGSPGEGRPGASAPSGMPVQYELAKPISVVSIPAAALYDTRDETGCVLGDGKPTPVTIVGSQLGQAFVIPANGADFSNVRLTTGEARSCG
ncbi:peptidoglycan hydrolase-like protein with peptidoglycan-binding domain [Leifsonia shinshuensis]|uniref:Peptidoglycan hydrolase-like protein with peptidoglycan-binding domain n=1 Tax=Leifsonia shinshuensis TaxID=150026 RepID=A0A853CRV3_9MICO|nr:peptidoglycan-binding domain-containing protein [Leifsonia shinshuensis]NYJ23088.1 peptidoglycan hydrolase-like protein with peptidoglycan-binding domain [Leifsonia shinshuensis]